MKNLLLLPVVLLSFNSVNAQCEKISEKKDKFENEVVYRYSGQGVSLSKYVTNDTTRTTYLYLSLSSTYLTTPEKGVILLFADGSTFKMSNQKVDYDYSSNGNWSYTAFIKVSEELNEKLLNSELTAFKLYIFDSETKSGKELSTVLQCLNDK